MRASPRPTKPRTSIRPSSPAPRAQSRMVATAACSPRETRAEATMEPGMDPGPTITGVTLIVKAKVPGIDAERFQQIAEAAKAGCVISRALSVPVGLQATLDA